LERVPTLPGGATLIKATVAGIDYAHLALPVAKIGPGQVDHWLCCADAVLWAEERWGRGAVTTERELRWIEHAGASQSEAAWLASSRTAGRCATGRICSYRPMGGDCRSRSN
jgi:hypothetical protein